MGISGKISKGLARRLLKVAPDADAVVRRSNDGITLDKIVIPEGSRGQGQGGAFMDELSRYADDKKIPVALTADGDYGGNKAAQMRFYKRHGFKENKGKSKNFLFQESMIRDPRGISSIGLLGGSVLLPDKTMADDKGSIKAPAHPGIAKLAGYANRYNRFLEQKPLLGMVAPEAPANLLGKMAYDDKRGYTDYLMAGLGMMP